MRPLSSIGLKVFFTTVPSSFLATLGDCNDDVDDGDDGDVRASDVIEARMVILAMMMNLSRRKIVMLATIAIRMYCTCS